MAVHPKNGRESATALSHCFHRTTFRVLVFLALAATCLPAQPVRVLQPQGDEHGFLVLQNDDGKEIAVGDQTYVARGNLITSHTVFRFRDGSVDDEECVFRQGSVFQLVRDRHIQKGPSFPRPIDVTIDVEKGEVSWTDLSKPDSHPKSRQMKLPSDLANGMVPLLIENLPHNTAGLTVPYLAVDSQPRLVKLNVTLDGSDGVLIGADRRLADRFNIHPEIGGVAGVLASLFGKKPPYMKVWIVGGVVPVFVRMDGPLYAQGPSWTILLSAPSWPTESSKNGGD
jgi:hypothetical protein